MGKANGIQVTDFDLAATVECPKFTYADVVLLVDADLHKLAQLALDNLEG